MNCTVSDRLPHLSGHQCYHWEFHDFVICPSIHQQARLTPYIVFSGNKGRSCETLEKQAVECTCHAVLIIKSYEASQTEAPTLYALGREELLAIK